MLLGAAPAQSHFGFLGDPWLEGRGQGAPSDLELRDAPGFVPVFSQGQGCCSVPVEGRMDELNYCWVLGLDMSYLLVFLAKPPSLGTEVTLQGVSRSWDQFGTHPREENVLWNFFFFFYLIQRIKSWRRRNAKEQHSGCHPLGADSRGGECVTWGSSPRAAEPSLLTFLFLMDKSTGSFQEIHHARVCFSWGSLKAFYFLSLFPVPCSYQRCAWRARAVLIEIGLYCS